MLRLSVYRKGHYQITKGLRVPVVQACRTLSSFRENVLLNVILLLYDFVIGFAH